MLHKNSPLGDNHILHNWAVANEAARLALPVVFSDRGKVAWQLDTNVFYFLSNNVGPVWLSCLGVPGVPGVDGVDGTNGTNGTNGLDGSSLIPQVIKSASYSLILSDANQHVLHPSVDTTARTFTIPSNAAVAYPIGTTLTFVNQNAAGVLSIANADVMRLAGVGTTGTRTLAANGMATALKITATEWIINGVGLT